MVVGRTLRDPRPPTDQSGSRPNCADNLRATKPTIFNSPNSFGMIGLQNSSITTGVLISMRFTNDKSLNIARSFAESLPCEGQECDRSPVSEDGSMEFALWGHGCAICSDSYMGVLYFPKDHTAERAGWVQTVVNSLDDARLPQEHGSVATGLYVVAIEPEWFIYRLEYQE